MGERCPVRALRRWPQSNRARFPPRGRGIVEPQPRIRRDALAAGPPGVCVRECLARRGDAALLDSPPALLALRVPESDLEYLAPLGVGPAVDAALDSLPALWIS